MRDRMAHLRKVDNAEDDLVVTLDAWFNRHKNLSWLELVWCVSKRLDVEVMKMAFSDRKAKNPKRRT